MHRYQQWRMLVGMIIGLGIGGCTVSAPASPMPTVMKYPFVTAGPTHYLNERYPRATTTPPQAIPSRTPTP